MESKSKTALRIIRRLKSNWKDEILKKRYIESVLRAICLEDHFLNTSFDVIILKEVLKMGANPHFFVDNERSLFYYACLNNKSYDFLKTLAYAGCWFNPAWEYRDSDEIRQLKKSKEECSVAVIIFCVLSKKTGAIHKDLIIPIASMIWEKRFDML
jgi:hypothetical protein